MTRIEAACKYLGISLEEFMKNAIWEKCDKVEAEIAQKEIESDPNRCNQCGGPNKPPGDICSKCWGVYWKSSPNH